MLLAAAMMPVSSLLLLTYKSCRVVRESKALSKTDIGGIEGLIQDLKVRTTAVAASVIKEMDERYQMTDAQKAFDILNPDFWTPAQGTTYTLTTHSQFLARAQTIAILINCPCIFVSLKSSLNADATEGDAGRKLSRAKAMLDVLAER